jgi:hypothetical protein
VIKLKVPSSSTFSKSISHIPVAASTVNAIRTYLSNRSNAGVMVKFITPYIGGGGDGGGGDGGGGGNGGGGASSRMLNGVITGGCVSLRQGNSLSKFPYSSLVENRSVSAPCTYRPIQIML